MSEPTERREQPDFLAIYMPLAGIHPKMEPISGESRDGLLEQARAACPANMRLSRIVRSANPSQNLWESGKGWLPTLEEQRRTGWR